MATEKQIAANRANAKRSTGPKTPAGRLKSSRNAYRHGLSRSLPADPTLVAKACAMAQVLTGDGEERLRAATEAAQAQVELWQIRAVRARMMATVDVESGDPQLLKRLLALDRYERFARTRRRRAARKL